VYLRDIWIGADERIVERYRGGFVSKFHRDTCCVVELFLKLIDRCVVTDGIAKVCFTFTDETLDYPEYSPGVCSYLWPFDFASYIVSGTPEKKWKVLEALTEALVWVGSREGWRVDEFRRAK
jgi:hypothetical protein